MKLMMKTVQHRIGGVETSGDSVRTAPVWDPATGEQQASVLLAETTDVDAAVQAGREAFQIWRTSSLTRRVA